MCRMTHASAEKLEHTGSAEKERVASVPQREQLTSTPEPSLPKITEPSVQSTRSWGEKVKVGESRTLASERGIRARVWSGKGGLHSERSRFQGGKGGQARRATPRRCRRKHKRVSGRKSSPGRSAESWFHS